MIQEIATFDINAKGLYEFKGVLDAAQSVIPKSKRFVSINFNNVLRFRISF